MNIYLAILYSMALTAILSFVVGLIMYVNDSEKDYIPYVIGGVLIVIEYVVFFICMIHEFAGWAIN